MYLINTPHTRTCIIWYMTSDIKCLTFPVPRATIHQLPLMVWPVWEPGPVSLLPLPSSVGPGGRERTQTCAQRYWNRPSASCRSSQYRHYSINTVCPTCGWRLWIDAWGFYNQFVRGKKTCTCTCTYIHTHTF